MNTKRTSLALAVIVGIGLAGFGASQAQAGHPWGTGIHVGHNSLHYGHGSSHVVRYSGLHNRLYYAPGAFGNVHGNHFDWHDTSHFDYHPGHYIFNGYSYQYVPGHWDFHNDGHWDFHRGGHYGR